MDNVHNNHQEDGLADLRKKYMENVINAKKGREDIKICLPVLAAGLICLGLSRLEMFVGTPMLLGGEITSIVGGSISTAGFFYRVYEMVANPELEKEYEAIIHEELENQKVKDMVGPGTIFDKELLVPIMRVEKGEDGLDGKIIGIDGKIKDTVEMHLDLSGSYVEEIQTTEAAV